VKIAAASPSRPYVCGRVANHRTLGQRIYKMQPEHGFAAQVAAGTTLYVGTHFGFPISTTHVVIRIGDGRRRGRGASPRALGDRGNIALAWL